MNYRLAGGRLPTEDVVAARLSNIRASKEDKLSDIRASIEDRLSDIRASKEERLSPDDIISSEDDEVVLRKGLVSFSFFFFTKLKKINLIWGTE